jgi:hypothetical protein
MKQPLLLLLLFLLPATALPQTAVHYPADSPPVRFGAEKLVRALEATGQRVTVNGAAPAGTAAGTVTIRLRAGEAGLRKEGFRIGREGQDVVVVAADPAGAMYGALELAEGVRMGTPLARVPDKTINPRLTVRALKFNLPWSPYRYGPAMDQHVATCRDLKFWQKLLDGMAENRFNVLSLWNVHPFSFMVKPKNFPRANSFSAAEMDAWQGFWKSLFRMARERGIEPYIVNWNIAVSPEFAAAYGVAERNDTSAIVKRYTREVVTQVIDEYEDLAGIGITLADWMSNFRSDGSSLPEMTPKDREDWIKATVVAGIKAARRPVKFLHRSVLSADPAEMRRVITGAGLPDTALVEIKFNWSHGHSTPTLALTHDSHSGARDDGYWNPTPTDYRIQWMVRNEDFFLLRWGQPDFIRRHLTANTPAYVNGYFVGSEGYIPAREYAHLPGPHRTWDYAFERQWLFYQLWGRLLYDPATPDAVFAAALESRYGPGTGTPLLEAYAAAGTMPLRLASFFAATWDYTLYSEGFLAPMPAKGLHDKVSSFISVDELIAHPTLDPDLLSIGDYVALTLEGKEIPAGKTGPLQLADAAEGDGRRALERVKALRPKAGGALACELDDLETWAHLGLYFAGKLRAGVALHAFRRTGDASGQKRAVRLLRECLRHWQKVSEITARHYQEVPYLEGQTFGSPSDTYYRDAWRFSWQKSLPQVERDIEIARKAEPDLK